MKDNGSGGYIIYFYSLVLHLKKLELKTLFIFLEVLFWSGVARGPPRKEKFPSGEVVQDLFKEALSRQ